VISRRPRDGRAKKGNGRRRKTAGDAPSEETRGYVVLVAELKQRIADGGLRAALSVNRELVRHLADGRLRKGD